MLSRLSQEIYRGLHRIARTRHHHHPIEQIHLSHAPDESNRKFGESHSQHRLHDDLHHRHPHGHHPDEAGSESLVDHTPPPADGNEVMAHHPDIPSTPHSSPSHHP